MEEIKTQEQIEKEAIEQVVTSEAWGFIKAKFEKYLGETLASVAQNDRPLEEIGAIIVAKQELAAALNEFLRDLDLSVSKPKNQVRSFR